jgi:hypothetical protein
MTYKITYDQKLEQLALALGFGHPVPIDAEKFGVSLRKGKTTKDLHDARIKSFRTPPFKTEHHLSLLEAYLESLVKDIK